MNALAGPNVITFIYKKIKQKRYVDIKICFDKKNVNIKEEYFCIMDLLGRIYKSLLKIKEKL